MTTRTSTRLAALSAGALLALAIALPAASASDPSFILASTTDVQDSGLLDHLLPQFRKDTGIEVRVVATGTGAALDMGVRCDAAGLLTHAKQQELKYVADGHGIDRHDVMYNAFVIVGPAADPAHVAGMTDVTAAMTKIYHDQAPFLSRGDKSGTNDRELELWQVAHLDPQPASGKWYRETGSGMGATLNTARAMGAYTLTDNATWANFKNKGDLKIVVQGDPRLRNQYGVMLVNPARCPKAKTDLARKFVDWMVSPQGQQAIGAYRIGGMQLYHPDAKQG
ncbi:MAG TPA: substrate-binding domain-containing protein [Rhodanobacteraceae bacterium]|nr:substrate-binding domain-containing protein [Rhodanobacteraceae bacterium]